MGTGFLFLVASLSFGLEPSESIPISPLVLQGARGKHTHNELMSVPRVRGSASRCWKVTAISTTENAQHFTKTRTSQPKSGTRALGDQTKAGKATQCTGCALGSARFQAGLPARGDGCSAISAFPERIWGLAEQLRRTEPAVTHSQHSGESQALGEEAF